MQLALDLGTRLALLLEAGLGLGELGRAIPQLGLQPGPVCPRLFELPAGLRQIALDIAQSRLDGLGVLGGGASRAGGFLLERAHPLAQAFPLLGEPGVRRVALVAQLPALALERHHPLLERAGMSAELGKAPVEVQAPSLGLLGLRPGLGELGLELVGGRSSVGQLALQGGHPILPLAQLGLQPTDARPHAVGFAAL